MANQTLSHALSVLRRFDARHAEWSVTGLSKHTGLSKSHVSKILKEFRTEGFLVQDQSSRRYRVGPTAVAVSAGYYSGSDIVRHAIDPMRDLTQRTGATTTLNVISNGEVLFVASREAEQNPQLTWSVGSYIPLHATAAGKVAAAFAHQPGSSHSLSSAALSSYTPSTIRDIPTLMRQLTDIRKQGLAFTIGESTYGLAGMAAPILDDAEHVVAAISVLYPATHAETSAYRKGLISAVRNTARLISNALGAMHYPYHN
jgi:DNA-binding IclR family transcriptional regulator